MHLFGADLEHAKRDGADLTGANLTFANLTGAIVGVPTLTGVVWSHTIFPDGTFSDSDGGTCVGHGN